MRQIIRNYFDRQDAHRLAQGVNPVHLTARLLGFGRTGNRDQPLRPATVLEPLPAEPLPRNEHGYTMLPAERGSAWLNPDNTCVDDMPVAALVGRHRYPWLDPNSDASLFRFARTVTFLTPDGHSMTLQVGMTKGSSWSKWRRRFVGRDPGVVVIRLGPIVLVMRLTSTASAFS